MAEIGTEYTAEDTAARDRFAHYLGRFYEERGEETSRPSTRDTLATLILKELNEHGHKELFHSLTDALCKQTKLPLSDVLEQNTARQK